MTIDDKIEALRSNFKTSDEELLDFMAELKRHAQTYTWQDGNYVYTFCKFYQKDIADIVKFLRKTISKTTAKESRAYSNHIASHQQSERNGVKEKDKPLESKSPTMSDQNVMDNALETKSPSIGFAANSIYEQNIESETLLGSGDAKLHSEGTRMGPKRTDSFKPRQ